MDFYDYKYQYAHGVNTHSYTLEIVMYINFSVHVQGQECRGQKGSALTEKGDRASNS